MTTSLPCSCSPKQKQPVPASKRLPPELVSEILNQTDDWELAATLGIRCDLPVNPVWLHASALDKAILSSRLKAVQHAVATSKKASSAKLPAERVTFNWAPRKRATDGSHLTQWGARVMLRFGYIDMLSYLLDHLPDQMRSVAAPLLPEVASAWGRTNVLDWAAKAGFGLEYSQGAMDASAIASKLLISLMSCTGGITARPSRYTRVVQELWATAAECILG